MSNYILAPKQMQALDIGQRASLVVLRSEVQEAPAHLWEAHNPRGLVERYFRGLYLPVVAGVRGATGSLEPESADLRLLAERCRAWVRHFGSQEALLFVRQDSEGLYPWETVLPSNGIRQVSQYSKWVLRSIFPAHDDALVLGYENVVGLSVKHDLSFNFEPHEPFLGEQLEFVFK